MQMSGSCLRRLKAASNHWFMDLSPHAVLVTLLLLLPLAPSQCDYALSMPTGLVLRTVHKPFRDDLLSLKFDRECYLNCKCQACIGFTDYWFHVSTWSTQSWNHKKTWNMYKMGGGKLGSRLIWSFHSQKSRTSFIDVAHLPFDPYLQV